MIDSLLAADAALRAWVVTHHTPWLDQVLWSLSAARGRRRDLGGHRDRDGDVRAATASGGLAGRPRRAACPGPRGLDDQAACHAPAALRRRRRGARRRLSPDDVVVSVRPLSLVVCRGDGADLRASAAVPRSPGCSRRSSRFRESISASTTLSTSSSARRHGVLLGLLVTGGRAWYYRGS